MLQNQILATLKKEIRSSGVEKQSKEAIKQFFQTGALTAMQNEQPTKLVPYHTYFLPFSFPFPFAYPNTFCIIFCLFRFGFFLFCIPFSFFPFA